VVEEYCEKREKNDLFFDPAFHFQTAFLGTFRDYLPCCLIGENTVTASEPRCLHTTMYYSWFLWWYVDPLPGLVSTLPLAKDDWPWFSLCSQLGSFQTYCVHIRTQKNPRPRLQALEVGLKLSHGWGGFRFYLCTF
jgi:hypothetical protein